MLGKKSLLERLWDRALLIPYQSLYLPYYRARFAYYGNGIGWGRGYKPIISPTVRIACPENISISDGCQFDEYTHLLATPQSKLVIGKNVRFANGFAHVVASFDQIDIEDDCLFAAFVQIINGNHGYQDVNLPVKDQPSYSSGPIRIGRGSWVGRGACILGGVTLGQHVVVGANAVVTESVSDFSVVVGSPAKVVKRYNFRSCEWERV